MGNIIYIQFFKNVYWFAYFSNSFSYEIVYFQVFSGLL